MKKIVSCVVLFSILLSMFSVTYAMTEENAELYKETVNRIDVNADYLYPDMNWVNSAYKEDFIKSLLETSVRKGFIGDAEKEVAFKIVDDYVELFRESCAYVLEHESETYWSGQDRWAKNLYRTRGEYYTKDERTFKDGQQVYTCYGIKHIEALINLMVYGIVAKDDSFMDLNGIPTRADGIILAVRMAGGEKEALSGQYKSSYVNLPEKAKGYIGYAEHIGILLPAASGTTWDNSDLSLGEAYAFFDRVVGKEVSNDNLDQVVKYSSLPSIYRRWGTIYNAYSAQNLLQAGEPLRNGDLVSLVNNLFYEKMKKSNDRIIDQLIRNNVISEEKKLFFDAINYYNLYRCRIYNDVNDFTKLLDYFDKENVEVNYLDYHHYAASIYFRPHEKWLGENPEWDKVIGVIHIYNGYDMSEERGQELLKKIAYGLGASESQGRNYAATVINQPKDSTKHDFKYGIDLNIMKNKIRLRSYYIPESKYLTRHITIKIFRQ